MPGLEISSDDAHRAAEVAGYWSDEHSIHLQRGIQWIEVPLIEANVRRRASDDPAVDWIAHSARFLANLPAPRKALSLGCGFGGLERELRRRDICQAIDGIDLAGGAIASARRLADEAGLTGLTYRVADLHTVELPPAAYDVVYVEAALHHVFYLERLLDQVRMTLKPNGLFVVSEYVGPSQMQFPKQHLDLADGVIALIPEPYRKSFRGVTTKVEAPRLSLASMNEADPSEAIRAQEIVPLIASRFEIEHYRNVGGTLLMLVFNDIAGNFGAGDPIAEGLARSIIQLEDRLIDSGELPSYHAYIVGRKTDDPLLAQTRDDWRPLPVRPLLSVAAAAPFALKADRAGGAPVGPYAITWRTPHGSSGEVRVCVDDDDEVRLLEGVGGSELVVAVDGEPPAMEGEDPTAGEIGAGEIGTAAAALLTATPNPVPLGSTGATIAWNTGNGEVGAVWVAVDGEPEKLFVHGAAGTQAAPWIEAGYVYTFRLYDDTARAHLLRSLVVRHGLHPVPTFRSGSTLEFRLYTGTEGETLLETVTVAPT